MKVKRKVPYIGGPVNRKPDGSKVKMYCRNAADFHDMKARRKESAALYRSLGISDMRFMEDR